jgi:hypothetical protein
LALPVFALDFPVLGAWLDPAGAYSFRRTGFPGGALVTVEAELGVLPAAEAYFPAVSRPAGHHSAEEAATRVERIATFQNRKARIISSKGLDWTTPRDLRRAVRKL